MVTTTAVCIQDRTTEFRSILHQVQRRQATTKVGQQRQSLLTDSQKQAADGNAPGSKRQRSEFARKAADIGRGISGTMAKLERLAQLARRKTLFDDRPVEIAELTYVIKQDLSALTNSISQLQSLARPLQQKTGDQEGEHNKNVVGLLQNRVADMTGNFKDIMEVRMKNVQASRSRTENFVSSVNAHSAPNSTLEPRRTDSPLYNTTSSRNSPKPGYNPDLLSLDPSSSSNALALTAPQSEQQLMMMEEAAQSNTYIQQRGQAIEAIEQTINELGGIFSQLAQMVSEQGEMIQRIDENTEDVVENVEGAQRELLKYWSRVQGNRWLIAKMFGVLMIFFLLWVLISG